MKALWILTLIISSISFSANARTFSECFNDQYSNSANQIELLKTCQEEDSKERLNSIKRIAAVPTLKEYKYSFDLGLGDPAFPGLKKARDKFLNKYIQKPISDIEDLRDDNMRRLNLKSMFGEAGITGENSMLSNLKRIFSLTDLKTLFQELEKKRKQRCEEKVQEKNDSCSTKTNLKDKRTCYEEARDVEDNCFKYTLGKSSALDKIRNKIGAVEDSILDKIDDFSLIKKDKIKDILSTVEDSTEQIGSSVDKINDYLSFNNNSKIDDILDYDPRDAIQGKISKMLGINKSALGPNSTSNRNTDLINFKTSKTARINNLCDLTACLIYPASKKGSSDYNTRCKNKGLTEEGINDKVNEIRRKLTIIVGKVILKQLMIQLPIQEYLKKIKMALICSVHATVATTKAKVGMGEAESSSSFTLESLLFKTDSMFKETSRNNEVLAQCLSEQVKKARSDNTISGRVGLEKIAGFPKTVGLLTTQVNLPFAGVEGQLKATLQNTINANPIAVKEIKACIAKGKSQEWQTNYENCNAGKTKIGLTLNFQFSIPELQESQRKDGKNQCRNNFFSNMTGSIKEHVTELKKNKDITGPISADSVYHARWDELDLHLVKAKKTLYLHKISPKEYFKTDSAICSDKVFDMILDQRTWHNKFKCKILDDITAPEFDSVNLKLDNFGLIGDPLSMTDPSLIPTVKRLCIDSSKAVNDFFKDKEKLSAKDIFKIKEDSNHVLNTKNSASEISVSEYYITRSIANIHYCDNFFTNVGNIKIDKPFNLDNLSNEKILLKELEDNKGDLKYNERLFTKKNLRDYLTTIEGLNKRTQVEKFNLCINNSKYRENLEKPELNGFDRAVEDFCKEYKIKKFDSYYSDALIDFDFDITNANSKKRVDKLIELREHQYKYGYQRISED